MALYLQMDGVDDYIRTPSLTFNKVVIELTLERPPGATYNFILDLRNGYNSFLQISNTNNYSYSSTSRMDIDGVNIAIGSSYSPMTDKKTLTFTTPSLATTVTTIFARNNNAEKMEGKLYDVKFYDAESLVAHYDMSMGTVQDQSGNGNHATLTGGTWVEDGEGGGTEPEPITHTLSLSDSITTSDAIFKRLSVVVVDTISTSENENENVNKSVNDSIIITDGSISYTQGKAVNLSDSIAILDSITKSLARSISDNVDLGDTEEETVLKSLVDNIALSDIISTFGGKSILLTDSITVTDSISMTKQLSRYLTESINVTDSFAKQSAQSIKLYDVIVTDDNISVFNPDAPNLIGIIHLKGKRELYVYLQGKRDLIVNLKGKRNLTIHLKGGLNMIKNQNFSMVAGDTTTLVIDINENLVGASVRWAIQKQRVPGIVLTKQGIIADGKIYVKLEKEDTEELQGFYSHECEVIDQQGNVSTVTSGMMHITSDII